MNTIARWEYRVVKLGSGLRQLNDEQIEAALNEMGEDGWEVISVLVTDNTVHPKVVAKRPLTERNRRLRDKVGWNE